MLHCFILLVLFKISPSKLKATFGYVPVVDQEYIALYHSLILFLLSPSISVSFDHAIFM